MIYKAILTNGRTANKTLDVEAGFVYKEELNETLDSATIKVKLKGESLDIEPMDFVQITGSVGSHEIAPKRLLVNDFNEDQLSFNGREDREYVINLFSQKKEMEKVTLPNVSITSLADGTTRSVLSYIEEFINRYSPKVKVAVEVDPELLPPGGDANAFSYENAWEISQAVRTRFANVVCPEFSWNKPTLAEVITDLMLVDDCIPTIKSNVLGFIDLRARGSEIDHTKIVRAVKRMNSQDYNQNLTIGMQNAIGSKPATMVEYISFRNETDGLLTTQNLQVVTQKPIYAVTKLVLVFRDKYYNSDTRAFEFRMTEIDMTPSVKEKNAYDVLDPTPLSLDENQFQQNLSTHQICNVYYKRGERVIDGWSKEWNLYGTIQTSVQFLTDHWLKVQEGHFFDNHTLDDFDWRDVMFRVEYESMGEITINAGRKLPLRNPFGQVFDGQGSSYVDVDQQSIFEYAKANRLGNKIIELSGTYHNEDLVPKCGQTYNGAVIFSRELQYFDDVINFHGYATENYVLLNYFVGVRAKKRSWALASGNEALTRHENVKYYAEFSFSRKADLIPSSSLGFSNGNFAEEFLSPMFRFYNDDSVKLCGFRSKGSSQESYPPLNQGSATYFIADCSAEKAGMSMAFTFQFTDNYSAGTTVSIDNNRYINHIQPYADRYGEFREFSLSFISDYDPADGEFFWGNAYVAKDGSIHVGDYVVLNDGNASWNRRVEKAREKPVSKSLSTSLCPFEIAETLHKDNREVLACTVQFEFCADVDDIIVTEQFVRKQKYLGGSQRDLSGLSIIGDASIYDILSLPEASEKFEHIGLIVRGGNGGMLLANASYYQDSDSWLWDYSAISADDTVFALIEGVIDSPWTTVWAGRRVRVVRFNKNEPAFHDYEPYYYTFISKVKITPGTKAITTGDDKIFYLNEGVAVTGYDKSARVHLDEGIASTMVAGNYIAWGVTDTSGNILFAVNVSKASDISRKDTLWLNLLRTRDCKVYESVSDRYNVSQESI